MIALYHVFWLLILVFAFIGMLRGWAKEVLVTFSVLTAIALNYLLERFVPLGLFSDGSSVNLFWVRTIILLVLVFFGYQTVNISKFAPKMRREKIQDSVLGFFFGALNGYAIAGTAWYYLNEANYGLNFVIQAPPEVEAKIATYITLLPPSLLGDPTIYFAVILSFIFVLAVFI